MWKGEKGRKRKKRADTNRQRRGGDIVVTMRDSSWAGLAVGLYGVAQSQPCAALSLLAALSVDLYGVSKDWEGGKMRLRGSACTESPDNSSHANR